MKEFLPMQRKGKYDLGQIVDAILWYLRIGSQWPNLPEGFPKCQNRSSLKAVVGKSIIISVSGKKMAAWSGSLGD